MNNNVQLLNDIEETARQILDGRQTDIWTAIPGIVQSVNFSKMTCTVQPSIALTTTDDEGNTTPFPLPLLQDVPIIFPQAGGFLITMPLPAGSEVLVIIASRCIDAWWQLGGINNPAMESRMHDLSDGFAIPGPMSVPNAALQGTVSSSNLQIRNTLGTTYVEITAAGGINLVSPTAINVTAPAVGIIGAVTITGALVATTVEGGTVPLTTHTHAVTTAPGTTGVPS